MLRLAVGPTVRRGAVLGASVLLLAGCGHWSARRTVSTEFTWRPTHEIHVSGRLTWQGAPPREPATVVVRPAPSDTPFAHETGTVIVPPQSTPSAAAWVEFRLDPLPMAAQETAARTERTAGGMPRTTTSVRATGRIDSWTIKTLPPQGWAASPSQRIVTADTSSADFTLRRRPQP